MVPFPLLGAQLSVAILVSRTPEARDCPDTEHFAAEVARIVGRPLATAGEASAALVVRADFSRLGTRYEAKVALRGTREGERLFHDDGPTCEAIADAVAVTTALLLDPSTRDPSPSLPRNSGGVGSALQKLWLLGRFGAGDGLTGGPTWLAGGGLEASLGPLTSIEIGATLAGPHVHPLGAGAVEVRLWYVELGGFRSLTGEEVRLGPCAQLMGGVRQGGGEGYPSSSSASLSWFAAGAGLRADVQLGFGFRLGARALALVPARKQSFSIGYVGTAYQSSLLSGVAEFILSVKFW